MHPQPQNPPEDSSATLEEREAAPNKPFACPHPGCKRFFTRRFNLRSHLLVHSAQRPYACEFCAVAFRRKHDLQRHIRSIHTHVRPYTCQKCGLGFARSDALKRHIET
ncbi:uncharacterized protein BJ171DRAFT_422205, partial [Polychytrium aggregatum]|uniref:uncharacterized protein n=1 Tax=Polychytrium aggregatum TaxID=110093 RepID=UPI0022FF3E6A